MKEYRIDKFLINHGLLSSITHVEPFMPQVIKEFYTNISSKFTRRLSKSIGKVYGKGSVVFITPESINKFMGHENHVDSDVSDNFNTMARLLT